MKKNIIALLLLAFVPSVHAELPTIEVAWPQASKTPQAIQKLVNQIFKTKCQGAMNWAVRYKQPKANVIFEDNFSNNTKVKYQATYMINYDTRFDKANEMNTYINVNYSVTRKNNKVTSVKVTAAEVADAYDSSFCDIGMLSKTEIDSLLKK